MGYFTYKSGVILSIWACFHPEMDLKATKMAFMANSSGKIFSNVVFIWAHGCVQPHIPSIFHFESDILSDISSHLWAMSRVTKDSLRITHSYLLEASIFVGVWHKLCSPYKVLSFFFVWIAKSLQGHFTFASL